MKLFEKIPGTSKLKASETKIRQSLTDKHGSHVVPLITPHHQQVRSMLRLQTSNYHIVIDDDPTYTPGSADNLCIYKYEYWLGEHDYCPSSQYSLRVIEGHTEVASCIFLTTGGMSNVHNHSAFFHKQ